MIRWWLRQGRYGLRWLGRPVILFGRLWIVYSIHRDLARDAWCLTLYPRDVIGHEGGLAG